MAKQYFYARSGQQSGPVSAATLKQLAAAGELGPEDLVWEEGAATKVTAKNVEVLFASSDPILSPLPSFYPASPPPLPAPPSAPAQAAPSPSSSGAAPPPLPIAQGMRPVGNVQAVSSAAIQASQQPQATPSSPVPRPNLRVPEYREADAPRAPNDQAPDGQPLKVVCPSCGARLRGESLPRSKKLKCPKCKTSFVHPVASSQVPRSPPPLPAPVKRQAQPPIPEPVSAPATAAGKRGKLWLLVAGLLLATFVMVGGAAYLLATREQDGPLPPEPGPHFAKSDGPLDKLTGWRHHETLVLSAEQVKQFQPESFQVSPNGRRWAYVAQKRGGRVAVIDGVEEPTTFPAISSLLFSADGNEYAYVGGASESGRETIIVSGRPATWRPDENRYGAPLMLLALHRGKLVYRLRDAAAVLSAERDFGQPDPIDAFSTSGPQLRWAKVQPGGLFVDGKLAENLPQGTITRLKFSRDGSAYVYVVKSGSSTEAAEQLVINGSPARRYPVVGPLDLSADGKNLAHLTQTAGGKVNIIVNAKAIEVPGGSLEHSVQMSADGARWLVASRAALFADAKSLKTYAGLITQRGGEYSQPDGPPAVRFSPDSRRLAYLVREDVSKKNLRGEVPQFEFAARCVVDGRELRRFPELEPFLLWSPDSRHVAYVASEEKGARVVIDDQPHQSYEKLLRDADGQPVISFSPDGRTIGYAGVRDFDWYAVLNGHELGAYNVVGVGGTRVGFTPDGHFTYLARKGDGSIWWVQESPSGSTEPTDKEPPIATADWIALFSGSNLDHWRTAHPEAWSIEDGVLTGLGTGGDLVTQGENFREFHLRFEVRTTHGAGAFIDTAKGRMWINNTPGERSSQDYPSTGSFAQNSAGSFHTISKVDKQLVENGQWCLLELLVRERAVRIRVNGQRVNAVTLAENTPPSGPITVRRYGQTMQFRKIEYREAVTEDEWEKERSPVELQQGKPLPVLALPEYTLEPGFEPLFNGKDLTGWEDVGRDPGKWVAEKDTLFCLMRNTMQSRIYTHRHFSDFHLRMVLRLEAGAEAAILMRMNKSPYKKEPDHRENHHYSVNLTTRGDRTIRGQIVWNRSGGGWQMTSEFPVPVEVGQWFRLDVLFQQKEITLLVNGQPLTNASLEADSESMSPLYNTKVRKEQAARLNAERAPYLYPDGPIGLQANGFAEWARFQIYRVDIKPLAAGAGTPAVREREKPAVKKEEEKKPSDKMSPKKKPVGR